MKSYKSFFYKPLLFLCIGFLPNLVKLGAKDLPKVTRQFGVADEGSFTENKGQLKDRAGNQRPDILFVFTKNNTRIYLRKTGISYVFTDNPLINNRKRILDCDSNSNTTTRNNKGYRLDVDFVNCNPAPKIISKNPGSSYSNYYLPSCPDGLLNVMSYKIIIYKDIYPGIDLVFNSNESGIEYDFRVNKGANPDDIKLKYNGADKLNISEKGNLNIAFALGNITENAPKAYDENSKSLRSSFVMNSDNETVTFHLSGYHHQAITIDPSVAWSTYLGGRGNDILEWLAIDKESKIYGVGTTNSPDFPVTTGAFQDALGSPTGINLCIFKFSSDGKLIWSTYFGGTGDDGGEFDYAFTSNNGPAIAIDSENNIVVISGTTSKDLPVTSGTFQTAYLGGSAASTFNAFGDAFFAKFNSDGHRLWATYYGDPNNGTLGVSVAIDHADNIYITGLIAGPGDLQGSNQLYGYTMPATSNYDLETFIAKFSSGGTRLWSMLYGGSKANGWPSDWPTDVKTDDSNNVIVIGNYFATNFSLTNTKYTGTSTTMQTFILKFDSLGNRVWASSAGPYLGMVNAAVDKHYNIYCVGFTGYDGVGLQFVKNSYQPFYGGGMWDAFLVKFDHSGNIIWGTNFGGSDADIGTGVTVDSNENVTICGVTASTDFPIKNPIQANNAGGDGDGFVSQFDKAGNLVWSTYYGGNGVDNPTDIEQDINGNLYFCGMTESGNYPVKNAFQSTSSGHQKGFITKFGNNINKDSSTNYNDYFKLYPSITPDILTVESETYTPVDYNYEVFDILGRVLFKSDDGIHNGIYKKTISLEPYAAAMYIIVSRVGTTVYTNKIIKTQRY